MPKYWHYHGVSLACQNKGVSNHKVPCPSAERTGPPYQRSQTINSQSLQKLCSAVYRQSLSMESLLALLEGVIFILSCWPSLSTSQFSRDAGVTGIFPAGKDAWRNPVPYSKSCLSTCGCLPLSMLCQCEKLFYCLVTWISEEGQKGDFCHFSNWILIVFYPSFPANRGTLAQLRRKEVLNLNCNNRSRCRWVCSLISAAFP